MIEDNKLLDFLPQVQQQMLALIRLAITGNTDYSLTKYAIDWKAVYDEAKKHCLLGIVFAGIEQLPEEKRPEMAFLMNWIWQAQRIKEKNEKINQKIKELSIHLEKHEFKGILLKGQGVAQLYKVTRDYHGLQENTVNYNVNTEGNVTSATVGGSVTADLSQLRTSGDIDIWIPNHSRKEILQFLRSTSKSRYMVYHNAEYPIFNDISVEVHFTPSWFWNPWRNKKFQKFCKESVNECLENNISLSNYYIPAPTLRFNRIFILQHIYRHVFAEGIGLRQLIDYYFVLVMSQESCDKEQWSQEKAESFKIIKLLGMAKFCGAVMWILVEYLGLDTKNTLCKTNEKEGHKLLAEILHGGNFGHDDKRYQSAATTSIGRFWHHIKHDFHYIHSYPGEVLWVPLWKIWHYFWRRKFTR